MACAAALVSPAYAASASGSLEDAFDTTFTAKQVQQAPARPAPTSGPVRQSFTANVVPLALAAPSRQVFSTPLEMSIAALADGSQGRIGVAAYDLQTGRSVMILGDQPFPMASTSKVAIVATYLAAVDAGRLRLDQSFALRMPVPSKKFEGDEAPVRTGAMLPAYELIEAAITHSDNHATDALLAAVGGPAAVTRWVQQSTGIGDFHLDRTI
ncbi:MAG: serine hydrolase, partial [Novosphingobium sp.]